MLEIGKGSCDINVCISYNTLINAYIFSYINFINIYMYIYIYIYIYVLFYIKNCIKSKIFLHYTTLDYTTWKTLFLNSFSSDVKKKRNVYIRYMYTYIYIFYTYINTYATKFSTRDCQWPSHNDSYAIVFDDLCTQFQLKYIELHSLWLSLHKVGSSIFYI